MATEVKFDPKTVQGDLIKLGYLHVGGDDGVWGAGSKRAIKRFKRRARTRYRITSGTGSPADCAETNTFEEAAEATVTKATLDEIKKWLDKKWKAPLGRFTMKAVANGKLREDVADAWIKLVNDIKAKGATIDGPYGDTKRGLGKAGKVGASSFSFHIVGRAVDLRQEFSDNPGRRYYIVKEDGSGQTKWRIYCTVEGESGTDFEKGKVKHWDFVDKKERDIPAGKYMDLTSVLERGGFERIPAQGGWEAQYNKTEWWHFQWAADKQETFEDECELVGISTKDLKAAGYSEHEMDRKPG